MNEIETLQLKKLIVATALYYGHQLHDQVLALYLEDLCDLPFERVVQAIKEVRRDAKTTRFPLASAIRAKIEIGPSDEDQAIEAANRIVGAVSKFGWNNWERARAYIGELGCRVVELEGGWQTICETLNSDNVGMLKAQWRGLAKATLTRYRAGVVNIAPRLENKRPSDGGLVPIADTFKSLTGPKGNA